MPRHGLLPIFRVCRVDTAGELHQARYPDGEPVYRTGLDPDRSLAAAILDATVIAENEGEDFVVVDAEGAVLHRAESFSGVPF